jgi:hypothetical protein
MQARLGAIVKKPSDGRTVAVLTKLVSMSLI